MRNREQRLQKRGENIARRTIRRARMVWKLRSFFYPSPLTFREYLLMRSTDRICALVGVRVYTSTFTPKEQVDAAKPVLQRLIDAHPDLTGRRLKVAVGGSGISMTPIWRSSWQVCA